MAADDPDWARKQERLTRLSTALTGTGAVTMAALLAGKSKVGRKVLPPKVHSALSSSQADDARNTVALASMVTGVMSGRSWAKKLHEDAAVGDAVRSHERERARNLAAALGPPQAPVTKGIVTGSVVRTARGAKVTRRALYRRPPMRRPRMVL
jgi:hypothetical protein